MSPQTPDEEGGLGVAGLVLPLWHARGWLLLCTLLGAVGGFALSLTQPPMFSGRASFVVQGVQRPSQAVVAQAPAALAGLLGPQSAAADLHVSVMQSQTVTDRMIDRFELQKVWQLRWRTEARRMLARRASFTIGRRDSVVRIEVIDESPHRAAEMANTYLAELRQQLRGFALQEAGERRRFYDEQLVQARQELERTQQALQKSGYDRAALRTEPRAAAEGYARLQADIAAAEVRLAATRRTRSESSSEVQQQLAELAAQRGQLARLEKPRDDGEGGFVARVREFRQAEMLVESMSRQAAAARVDEAAEAVPLQVLDQAIVPEWPSSPRRMTWLLAGALLGFGGLAALVLARHRLALARLDPAHQRQLQRVRAGLRVR